MAMLYMPPLPGLRKTFDYLASRDGLALQVGGANRVDSRAGYIADIKANPSHIWQPRLDQNAYTGFISILKGQNNQDLGHHHWQIDPESGLISPFFINGDGDMVIRARRTNSAGFNVGDIPNDPNTGLPFSFVTGLVTTKDAFSQRGGYWEITAKVPTGTASWPAIWMYPQGESLGVHIPEIDIVEVFGGEPGYNTAHYYNNAIGTGYLGDSDKIDLGTDVGAGFHKFGLKHTSDSLTFYCDDKIVAIKDVSNRPEFWTSMYLILSMQIGSRINGWVPPPNETTPDPADLIIRSVRAWQFT